MSGPERVASWGAALLLLAAPCLSAEEDGSTERLRFEQLDASAGDFSAAVAAHRRGELRAAREAYRASIEKDPAFVEAMVNLARVELALGEHAEAARWLDRAAAGQHRYPGVHAARGLLALERGDAAWAIDELSRARALVPDDVEVLTNLGAALLAIGQNEGAVEVLDRAQRLDPRRAMAPYNLALAHDRAGRVDRARFHYRRFLALAPAADPGRAAVEARLAELNGAPRADSGPPDSKRDLQTTPGAQATAQGGTNDD